MEDIFKQKDQITQAAIIQQAESQKITNYIKEKGCAYFAGQLIDNVLSKSICSIPVIGSGFIGTTTCDYRYGLIKTISRYAGMKDSNPKYFDIWLTSRSDFLSVLDQNIPVPSGINHGDFLWELRLTCMSQGDAYTHTIKHRSDPKQNIEFNIRLWRNGIHQYTHISGEAYNN